MNESWPPQSHKFSTRSPKKRTWFCSTSIVAPSRAVKEAGLFELTEFQSLHWLTLTARQSSQDKRPHRRLSTSRRAHKEDLYKNYWQGILWMEREGLPSSSCWIWQWLLLASVDRNRGAWSAVTSLGNSVDWACSNPVLIVPPCQKLQLEHQINSVQRSTLKMGIL